MPALWNNIQSAHLAIFCGLPAPALDIPWQEWVDALSIDDLDLVRGVLSQKFGRLTIDIPVNDVRVYLLAYISRLEQEFEAWLNDTSEVIDYFLATSKIGAESPEFGWHWLPEHISLWNLRGRGTKTVPNGIRLAPLVAVSLHTFVRANLHARVDEFFLATAASASGVEHWLSQIEIACRHLKVKEDAVGVTLALLRATRRRHSGIRYEGFVSLADVDSVEFIAIAQHAIGLLKFLTSLKSEISLLDNLGKKDHWIAPDAPAILFSMTEEILERRRDTGELNFKVRGGEPGTNAKQVAVEMNRLRESLSAEDFTIFEARIDRVQAAIECLESAVEYRENKEKEIQNALEHRYSFGKRLIDSANGWTFSIPQIDHWRNPS